MTKPIPMYTQDKSRNFGHAIVGYYSDGHKWMPVNVNEDGYLLFKQDPDTAAAITALASSIEALVEYVHSSCEDMEETIDTDIHDAVTGMQTTVNEAVSGITSATSSMQTTINNATTQMVNTIDMLLTDSEAESIVNNAWGA